MKVKPSDSEIFDFSNKIEEIACEHDLNFLESVIYFQETTGVETEVITGLISPALKSKIESDAQNLNLLKSSSKLPL